jgi:hypothetical protein
MFFAVGIQPVTMNIVSFAGRLRDYSEHKIGCLLPSDFGDRLARIGDRLLRIIDVLVFDRLRAQKICYLFKPVY